MLLICGFAEMIGLFAYRQVFENMTATGCCGIISQSADPWICNENDFTDGQINHIIDNDGNRICAVNQQPCTQQHIQSSTTLYDCFHNITNYEYDDDTIVNGHFNISDLCSDDAIVYEQEHASDVAMRLIHTGMAIVLLSSLLAIVDILKYFGCIKKECCLCRCISKWISCKCCWKNEETAERCGIFPQVIMWIFLFVFTKMNVEDATSDTYKVQGYENDIVYDHLGYSRRQIGAAVADKCDARFLWMDYDIEHVPAIVEDKYYEMITSIGLVFSIIEFAIAFILAWFIKDFEDGEDSDDDNIVQMCFC